MYLSWLFIVPQMFWTESLSSWAAFYIATESATCCNIKKLCNKVPLLMNCEFKTCLVRCSVNKSVCDLSHGRCPICKRFCPKSYESCLHLWLQLLLLSVPVVLPNLQEEVGHILCLYRIPTQKSPGVLNQVIMVAKLSFHHVQSQQPPCDWGGTLPHNGSVGVPHLVEKWNLCPYLVVTVAWNSF
jgi:hypothetical protein